MHDADHALPLVGRQDWVNRVIERLVRPDDAATAAPHCRLSATEQIARASRCADGRELRRDEVCDVGPARKLDAGLVSEPMVQPDDDRAELRR